MLRHRARCAETTCRGDVSVRAHVLLQTVRCAANKSDLAEERVITEEEGLEASQKHNCAHYAETSAKTSEGIDGALPLPPVLPIPDAHSDCSEIFGSLA
jgi:hypothetical protein